MTTETTRRHAPALVCLLPGLALLALALGSLAEEGLFDGLRALTTVTPASAEALVRHYSCLLYTSPSPRDRTRSRMPSSA